MKCIFPIVVLLSLFLTSCAEKQETKILHVPNSTDTSVEIPDRMVDKSALYYDNMKSLWTINDELYSGFAVRFYPDSTLEEKIGIVNGRKQNQATKWYPDGQLKEVANYHLGKLHGEKKRWSLDSNYVLLAHLNYNLGKAHGEQKQWYPTGELYKKMNLNMGKEEGIQQAFRKNGNLYANYEARNGRLFGLKKTSLCYGLEDENINFGK